MTTLQNDPPDPPRMVPIGSHRGIALPTVPDPMLRAQALAANTLAALRDLQDPRVLTERLAWVVERMLGSVPLPIDPVHLATLAWTDLPALDDYLDAHAALFGPLEDPEGYEAEFYAYGALQSLVIVLFTVALKGDPVPPTSVESVLRGAISAIRGCPLEHPEGPLRHLQATYEVLDAMLLTYAANDNDSRALVRQ